MPCAILATTTRVNMTVASKRSKPAYQRASGSRSNWVGRWSRRSTISTPDASSNWAGLVARQGAFALPVSGDDEAAKAVVLKLIDEVGFDGVDAGGLDESWRQQPGTPAYCTDLSADGVR